jgi:protein-tyrosine phosphatase
MDLDYLAELRNRDEISVSFVCLGNICRSPMAAAIFSNRTKDLSRPRAIVESGGTSSWHIGQGPHPQSKRTWERAGYEYSHRASQFTNQDLERIDLILTMDSENHTNVIALSSDDSFSRKVFMMRDFDSSIEPGASVPDPYSQDDEAYEHVKELLESAIDGLIATIWNL